MKKSTRSNTILCVESENDFEESDFENNENCNDRSFKSHSNKNGIFSSTKKQKILIKSSPQSLNEIPLRSTRSRGNTNSNQTNNNNNDKTNNSSPQSIIYVSDSDITNHSEDISFKGNNNVFIDLFLLFLYI
jgi:hypothetical protein